MLQILEGNNLDILKTLSDNYVDLIYADPPFNVGIKRTHTQIKTIQNVNGDREGFQSRRYKTVQLGTKAYNDIFDDYLAFLEPRLLEVFRILKKDGSFLLHLDYREVHYAKVLLDQIFGRDNFMNEIIWAYDFGGRSKKKWSAKHDNILWYAKDHKNYTFNYDEMDRIPYLAPKLVGEEKAKRGKTPTSVHWHTIVPTNGKEKTGYPTQKPLGLLNRFVKVHSNPGDLLLDPFAGSGSFGESSCIHDRNCILIDENPVAIEIMNKRLGKWIWTNNDKYKK
jgi:site-specific DNA-methyltransferase (adenine-specific)